jgi:hypothetical protein
MDCLRHRWILSCPPAVVEESEHAATRREVPPCKRQTEQFEPGVVVAWKWLGQSEENHDCVAPLNLTTN